MSSAEPESGRLPFDPNRISPHRSADDTAVTVSQLTRMVKGAIEKGLSPRLHVLGELSNVSRPTSGHLYFTLKDASSEVRCVMWRSDAQSLKFDLADGLEVVATGSVDVYEPRGQYQLYVRRLEPRGVGALELAFAQLKERLSKEGLFDPSRKRALPKLPVRIAVVTSTTGAAVRDILQTLRRRYPKVHVMVFGVRVQGEGAAEEIADAIRRINRSGNELGGIDVMIVGRGGGSLEDLWAFNEEMVARAIASSEIPVVSAVGHEVDFTIADFAADVRAATPTAAAELVVPVLDDLLAEIEGLRRRLLQAMLRRLETARSRLAAVERSAWFLDPVASIRRHHQRIDELISRLRFLIARGLTERRSIIQALELRLIQVRPAVQLARRRERVASMEHRLRWSQGHRNLVCERRLLNAELQLMSASPRHRTKRHRDLLNSLETRLKASCHEQVLKRGFTITRLERNRKLVKKANNVREGDRLVTETADGKIASRVVDLNQGELFE